MKKISNTNKAIKPAILTIVIVGLAAFGGIYFKKYQDLKNNPIDSTQIAEAQNNKTIEEVSKLYKLPEGEEPTIFTVVDTQKLKEQYPALSAAEQDDKVLLYTNAKVAIVYRPKDNKIVSVVNVTISQKVGVRIVGTQAARDAIKKVLSEKFAELVELKGEGDAKTSPTITTIVDVTSQQGELAQQISASVSGSQVGQLPAGEDAPNDVEILIVAGTPAASPL